MKHLFVPYPLALLAKEKGFKELCFGHYYTKDKSFNLYEFSEDFKDGWTPNLIVNKDKHNYYFSAPLYQQLVDWFREKHNILIHQVLGFSNNHWCFKIQSVKNDPRNIDTIQESGYYACFNAALTEAFKLI